MANPRAYPPKLFLKKWEEFSGPLPDGPFANDLELVNARIAQEDALKDFAQQQPFPPEELAKLRQQRASGGQEHEVFVPLKGRRGSRVWKVTRPDRWGLIRATPLEYARRLDRFDQLSGTHVLIEGIAIDQNLPLLVTTMDFILGDHPEGQTIHNRLLAEGWETAPDPDGMMSYRHKIDRTLMRDAHPKNFILTAGGLLVPIDVIFMP